MATPSCAEVVPGRAASAPSEPVQLGLGFEAANASEPASTSERVSRHPWAWLLARVFAVDVTVCPHGAGRMRLVKLATTREELTNEEQRVGLGAELADAIDEALSDVLEAPARPRLRSHRTW